MTHGRRVRTTLALTTMVASITTVVPALGATNGARTDGVDGQTPMDLREASLTPRGDQLEWSVLLREPLRPGAVAPDGGGRLCLLLGAPRSPTATQRLCVVGHGRARLTLRRATFGPDGAVRSAGPVEGEVIGGTTRRLRMRFAIGAVGMAGRRVGWRAFARSTDLTGCAQPAVPCTDDVVPDAGPATLEVPTTLSGGCIARGAAEVTRFSREGRRVALTFDDGPGASTDQVLRILARERVVGTFFVTGSSAAGRGPTLRRMLREGHAIGNHTFTHASVGGGGAAGQIISTQRAIRRATGYAPCVFRPPYGATSARLVREVRGLGLTSVLWDVDPQDWRRPGSRAIVSRVLSLTRAGSIILTHDAGGPRAQTVAALPKIIRTLRRRGLRFVTLPDALGYERLPRSPGAPSLGRG